MSSIPVLAIVDDDPAVRQALSDLVEAMGFRTSSFDSAADFLAAFTPGIFACVLSDIRMPGTDGLELQTMLGARDPALPLIFVTSVQDGDVHRQARQRGARAILSKPVDADALERTLRSVLWRR
ncbi:response regulator transcription factor [Sphingomonas sp. ASY06-1R]|uniref:response regulator transcription factor n=1 Tax=Sphingomonas sp. ASY06-1R TaxID=3445771 RepID=UPI003FA1EF8F